MVDEHTLLTFWWQCLRKVSYPTDTEAHDVSEDHGSVTTPYACPYGGHWHNGRPVTGENRGRGASHRTGPAALRARWRRYRDAPSIEEIRAAYEVVSTAR